MTFQAAPWAIDGSTVDAVLSRLQLQSGTQSRSGVVQGGDLKVSALATPGPQVVIGSGAFVANGVEAAWQGSYYAYNIGSVRVDIAAQGSSGPRSDLVYARIEDPTISGSRWSHNVATDPLVYPVVKSGVSGTETQVPPGETGVPLARIDLPANASAVTASMIHDLRQVANPRSDRQLIILNPTASDYLYNGDAQKLFPSQAQWQIVIPSWAVTMQVIGYWGQILAKVDPAISATAYGPWADAQLVMGSKATQYITLDSSSNKNADDPYRTTAMSSDTWNVAGMAGTVQTLSMQAKGHTSGADQHAMWFSDSSSTMVVDIEFLEGVV